RREARARQDVACRRDVGHEVADMVEKDFVADRKLAIRLSCREAIRRETLVLIHRSPIAHGAARAASLYGGGLGSMPAKEAGKPPQAVPLGPARPLPAEPGADRTRM